MVNSSTAIPKSKPDLYLVQVIGTALNPIDYKQAEVPLTGRFAIMKPATPGNDFAGRIIIPASGSLQIKPGQLVFGVSGTSLLAGGAFAEFSLAKVENVASLPDNISPLEAAAIGVAALTA